MNIFLKLALAFATAAITWLIAYGVGGNPRPLDFYIFYAIEYCGLTIVLMRKGWDQ